MVTNIADLTGVRAKLKRAKEHQSVLEAEVDIWGKQQANVRRFKIRCDGLWHIVTCEPLPQPDIRFSIIAGDLIHNLRSALDHLVYQLVLREGQQPSHWNEFPIYESKQRFLEEVKVRKSRPECSFLYGITVDGDAWTIIEKAQPYTSPNPRTDILGIIGRLSILDKHRTLCVQIPFVGDIRKAISWNPDAILLEERIGALTLSLEKPTEVVRYRFADQPNPNMHVQGRLTINPTFGEGDIEGSCQFGIGFFNKLINSVASIVDEVSKLPRVINT